MTAPYCPQCMLNLKATRDDGTVWKCPGCGMTVGFQREPDNVKPYLRGSNCRLTGKKCVNAICSLCQEPERHHHD